MTREHNIKKTEKLIRELVEMGILDYSKPLTPESIRELAEAAVEGGYIMMTDFPTEGSMV